MYIWFDLWLHFLVGCVHDPCMNGGECKMITSTRKIACDCKENYAGKFCNIGKYNNLQADRIRSFHLDVRLVGLPLLYSAFEDISCNN